MEDEKKLPYNIKENVKNFLLDEVFHSCRTNKMFDFEAGMFMMIVDEKSISVLNSFVQYSDLMEKGVAGLEKLTLQRKKFPKMHAIYFIASNRESIDLLAKDFEDKSKPHYGFLHIIFYNGCSDDMLEYLLTKKEILSMIVNIKVIQLQFNGIDETTFTLNQKGLLPVLYGSGEVQGRDETIEELSTSVSTLVTALKDFHNIQIVYSKGGKGTAKTIAEKVNSRLSALLQKKSKPVLMPPPVTMILMDRTEDLMTPLKHDLYYNSLTMDLLQIKNNKWEHEVVNGKGEKTIKISSLNETDSLWLDHRNRPFLVALKKIVFNFNDFLKNNSNAQMQSGNIADLNIDKMSEIIRKMPQYQDMLGEYTFHIAMLERMKELFERRGLDNLANIENILAVGTDKSGKPKTIENISACTNCEYDHDQVRMALMMLLSKHCDSSVSNRLKVEISGISKAAEKAADGLEKIGAQLGNCQLYKKDVVKDPENPLADCDRSMSHISQTVLNLRLGKEPEGFGKLTLPDGENFPDIKVKRGSMLASKLGTSNVNSSSTPIVIVCVLGGISVNEIRELRCLEKNAEIEGYITIMGGTMQMTPQDYLKELQRVMGPIEEDIEELNKEKQKEEWLQKEFAKDQEEARKLKENPNLFKDQEAGATTEPEAPAVELKEKEEAKADNI
jgi:syntaxin-binding protein 1